MGSETTIFGQIQGRRPVGKYIRHGGSTIEEILIRLNSRSNGSCDSSGRHDSPNSSGRLSSTSTLPSPAPDLFNDDYPRIHPKNHLGGNLHPQALPDRPRSSRLNFRAAAGRALSFGNKSSTAEGGHVMDAQSAPKPPAHAFIDHQQYPDRGPDVAYQGMGYTNGPMDHRFESPQSTAINRSAGPIDSSSADGLRQGALSSVGLMCDLHRRSDSDECLLQRSAIPMRLRTEGLGQDATHASARSTQDGLTMSPSAMSANSDSDHRLSTEGTSPERRKAARISIGTPHRSSAYLEPSKRRSCHHIERSPIPVEDEDADMLMNAINASHQLELRNSRSHEHQSPTTGAPSPTTESDLRPLRLGDQEQERLKRGKGSSQAEKMDSGLGVGQGRRKPERSPQKEPDLPVYSQQMKRAMEQDLRDPAAPGLGGETQIMPNLAASASAPNLFLRPLSTLDLSTDQREDDEDEEIPLAVLAAQRFSSRNRPPARSAPMSTPNLHATLNSNLYPSPSAPVLGQTPNNRARLPAFAQRLPSDPFNASGIANQYLPLNPNLQQGMPMAPQSWTQPQPGGLVGVIASEEQARAMRRGSAVATMPASPTVYRYPAQGPGNRGLPYADEAQMQMAWQMEQFMQMQQMMMQQMAQMQYQNQMLQQRLQQHGLDPGLEGMGSPPASRTTSMARPISTILPELSNQGSSFRAPSLGSRSVSFNDPRSTDWDDDRPLRLHPSDALRNRSPPTDPTRQSQPVRPGAYALVSAPNEQASRRHADLTPRTSFARPKSTLGMGAAE